MNNQDFKFDSYFNRYLDNLLHRNREPNAEFRFVQRANLAQSKIDDLTIEQVIVKAINKFEAEKLESGEIVRTDAKLFLVMNYSSMVYYPLSGIGNFNKNELKHQIFSEVGKILNEAHEMSSEITAHKILQAGNQIWDSLRTLSKGSW